MLVHIQHFSARLEEVLYVHVFPARVWRVNARVKSVFYVHRKMAIEFVWKENIVWTVMNQVERILDVVGGGVKNTGVLVRPAKASCVFSFGTIPTQTRCLPSGDMSTNQATDNRIICTHHVLTTNAFSTWMHKKAVDAELTANPHYRVSLCYAG